jgi:hypothetical protein
VSLRTAITWQPAAAFPPEEIEAACELPAQAGLHAPLEKDFVFLAAASCLALSLLLPAAAQADDGVTYNPSPAFLGSDETFSACGFQQGETGRPNHRQWLRGSNCGRGQRLRSAVAANAARHDPHHAHPGHQRGDLRQ